jgi:GT2 family glycosyltransferase
MEKNPKLSIVTAYYNRKELFLKTLESIESSERTDEIEVVVVDDGSSEDQRLEDIRVNHSFPIHIIRQDPEDKDYINPCVPFNIAINKAKGDLILLQNPECYHVGEVISKAIKDTTDDNYLVFAAYAMSKKDTENFSLGSKINLLSQPSDGGQQEGWYNHSVINPRPLHFASCITKKNLDDLGGFDEAYAQGIGYDDDELLMRIKDSGLKVQICDNPFVLHQNHYDENAFESKFRNSPHLFAKNKELYISEYRKRYKPKIVGFSQLHNELELGNLENWFKCMEVCDEIYIFDQASTDGSREYYKKFDNVHVIESDTNRFEEELVCKQELLEKLLSEQPDTDWIFWMDGDTLLDARLLFRPDLEEVLFQLDLNRIDSGFLGHYNLWRSDLWHRVDDQYDHFMQAGRMAFWKNTGNLMFNTEVGLHKSQHPVGIRTAARMPFNLIHRGFATDEQILTKYDNYKSRGQSGWALDRILNESTLRVEKVPREELPHWLEVDEQNPKQKKRLKDIYESR